MVRARENTARAWRVYNRSSALGSCWAIRASKLGSVACASSITLHTLYRQTWHAETRVLPLRIRRGRVLEWDRLQHGMLPRGLRAVAINADVAFHRWFL